MDGQATPEYVGIVLVVTALFGLLVTLTPLGGAGAQLARAVGESLLCAVKGEPPCGFVADELTGAYGTELAALVREHAPEIRFEDADGVSLPVDPRRCRLRSCADTSESGNVRESSAGQQATAFVRLVDCRDPAEPAPPEASCDGDRAGNVYLQYWLYYPDSATRGMGRLGYHLDDWESFQVRISPAGATEARASSHHSYNSKPEPINLSDVGKVGPLDLREKAWGPSGGYVWVSAGSHAGRSAGGDDYFRAVPPDGLRLIPIESNLARLAGLQFEEGILPPWRKRVYADPEWKGT